MSMIGSQIDELRELVGDGSMEWVAGPVRASVLREAADTIWELRCKLSNMVDERERARVAEAENAKLRELVADMWREGAFLPGACYVEAAGELEERTRELGIEVGG